MANFSNLPNPSSLLEYKGWKFLIFDAPTDANLDVYIKEFKKHNVTHIARACDPSYATDKLEKEGIKVSEMSFADGGFPNESIVSQWLALCRSVYKGEGKGEVCIGVHCVAGLGRAPVLVAIALIELGMHYEEAITFIRDKRKGAINAKQLKFLKSYNPKKKCSIM